MKRKLLTVLIGLTMLFSLNSCDTYSYATTQDDIYVETQDNIVHSNVDFNVVIQYGTPYYHNGSILYYIYNNLYYYPFYYNNYWYVRVYNRPFNHLRYRPYFRPHRYDYRFTPGLHRGFDRPNIYRYNNNRFYNRRQDVIPNRPRQNNSSNINRGAIRMPNRMPNKVRHFDNSRR